MDTNTVLDDNLDHSSIGLTTSSIQSLRETARWAKFLSIVGFIFVGFMVIASFFMGTIFASLSEFNEVYGAMGSGGGILMTVMYLILAAVYFFPCLYLYRFATKTKAALTKYDTTGVTEGLKNMKNYFQFVGILTAIFIGLYGLILIFALIGGLVATL